MKAPLISIIIPTYYGSVGLIEKPLRSITNQTCDKEVYEIIIADNKSDKSKKINEIARNYNANVIEVEGVPPQTCNQVNAGAKVAKGEFIFILDHDIHISETLLQDFITLSKTNKNIHAWFVPYKIMAHGYLLNEIRNFEEAFYKDSVIAAVRIIKRSIFWETKEQYDPMLSSGPADWDLTNQLRMMNIKFKYTNEFVYHHEEHLQFKEFITKKVMYAEGGELYKEKWRKRNTKIYDEIVKKQYSLFYRLFWIFIENEKWRKLLPSVHKYLLFLSMKILIATNYFIYLKSNKFYAKA